MIDTLPIKIFMKTSTVCVSCKRLSLSPKLKGKNVFIGIRSAPNGKKVVMPITNISSSKMWTLPLYRENDLIEISLMKSSGKMIANLALPLKWFQPDSIVEEWFPFKNISNIAETMMCLLSVHIITRCGLPFQAPIGRLLVVPAWKRPQIDVPHCPPQQHGASMPNPCQPILVQMMPPQPAVCQCSGYPCMVQVAPVMHKKHSHLKSKEQEKIRYHEAMSWLGPNEVHNIEPRRQPIRQVPVYQYSQPQPQFYQAVVAPAPAPQPQFYQVAPAPAPQPAPMHITQNYVAYPQPIPQASPRPARPATYKQPQYIPQYPSI